METLKSNWRKIEGKKKEWLNFYKKNTEYKNVNMKVLQFINEITFFPNLDCTSDGCIDNLFLNGYCYYSYDITGVYEDYEELRPVSYLGTTIVDFLHNGEKWKSNDKEFEKYCKEKNVEEIYEIETIWMNIPKEILKKYDKTNLTLPEVALDYWHKNK